MLACSTSDQLLYLAQSLTSKLKVSNLIQRARDMAVQMGNSKGLSEQLSALLIQVGKDVVKNGSCLTIGYNTVHVWYPNQCLEGHF